MRRAGSYVLLALILLSGCRLSPKDEPIKHISRDVDFVVELRDIAAVPHLLGEVKNSLEKIHERAADVRG